jgi:hypothetical protein
MGQGEVEGEVQLVGAGAKVGRPSGDVEDVDLAEEHAPGLVRINETAPVSQDLVRLRTVHRVDAPEAVCTCVQVVVLGCRRVVAQLPVLDQRVTDVDSDAREAAVEPEAENAFELGSYLGVPPVEVGLLAREVVQVVAAAFGVERPSGAAAEGRPPVVRYLVRPDVEVRPLAEPWMAVGRVVWDEVEEHTDSASTGLFDKSLDVRERAEIRVDAQIVGDVVAPVDVRRRVDRIQPDSIDAEPLEVVELLCQTRKITDAVLVSVSERPGVDLVEDTVAPPVLGHRFH